MAMGSGLLKGPVETRLSAMIGAEVTFEKLNVSLLGGSVEAQGVVVAGADPSTPLLTIRRVRAEIALGKALKKEFVVKSLAVERPVLTIVQRPDGSTNLPKPFCPEGAPDESEAGNVPGDRASPPATDEGGEDDVLKAWKLEAQKVLLVDGEVHFRREPGGAPTGGGSPGFHFALEKILGEIKQSATGMDFTLLIDAAGRRDGPAPAELGAVRLAGSAAGVRDLSQWQAARIQATFDVGPLLHGELSIPSLNPPDVTLDLHGSLDLAPLLPLLPEGLLPLAALGGGSVTGRVQIEGQVSYSAAKGLRVPEFNVRVVQFSLGRGGRGENSQLT